MSYLVTGSDTQRRSAAERKTHFRNVVRSHLCQKHRGPAGLIVGWVAG